MDLRADKKNRMQKQRDFILAHPKMDDLQLADMMKSLGIFSKGTWLREIRASIARIRRHQQLIDEGRIVFSPDPYEERIAEIARKEPPPSKNPEAAAIKKRAAVRSLRVYLEECDWKKVRASQGVELSFWKDPKTGSVHRLDMAFFVATSREAEISRLSKELRSSWRTIEKP